MFLVELVVTDTLLLSHYRMKIFFPFFVLQKGGNQTQPITILPASTVSRSNRSTESFWMSFNR